MDTQALRPIADANPVIVAWRARLNSGMRELLVLDVDTNPDPACASHCYQELLLLAIATDDNVLVNMLAERGITSFLDDDPSGGVLSRIIQEFGDAPEVIERALKRGARLEARGMNDWTPLHLACRCGYMGVVRTLVELGADVNDETSIDDHWTPIMEAADSDHKEIVEFLLDHGADPRGSLYMARKRGRAEMVAVLDRPKPDVWASKRKRKSP